MDQQGTEQSCTGEWGPYNMEIVDMIEIDANLPAGKWVLNWRMDQEESNQIWQSCAGAAPESPLLAIPIASFPAITRPSLSEPCFAGCVLAHRYRHHQVESGLVSLSGQRSGGLGDRANRLSRGAACDWFDCSVDVNRTKCPCITSP